MNFGEKFPYALLTFSQSLSKLIVGHTFSQKFVEAGYWPHLFHARTPSPKSCRSWLLGYTTPQSLPTRPAPHQLPYPTHHTTYTPTIHQLYTHHTQSHNPPHTPPLRVDSDEMRQNRKVLALRCWNARKGPRMGPKVHEVDSALARAQTKVDEVYGPYGSSPNPAKFAPSPSKSP